MDSASPSKKRSPRSDSSSPTKRHKPEAREFPKLPLIDSRVQEWRQKISKAFVDIFKFFVGDSLQITAASFWDQMGDRGLMPDPLFRHKESDDFLRQALQMSFSESLEFTIHAGGHSGASMLVRWIGSDFQPRPASANVDVVYLLHIMYLSARVEALERSEVKSDENIRQLEEERDKYVELYRTSCETIHQNNVNAEADAERLKKVRVDRIVNLITSQAEAMEAEHKQEIDKYKKAAETLAAQIVQLQQPQNLTPIEKLWAKEKATYQEQVAAQEAAVKHMAENIKQLVEEDKKKTAELDRMLAEDKKKAEALNQFHQEACEVLEQKEKDCQQYKTWWENCLTVMKKTEGVCEDKEKELEQERVAAAQLRARIIELEELNRDMDTAGVQLMGQIRGLEEQVKAKELEIQVLKTSTSGAMAATERAMVAAREKSLELESKTVALELLKAQLHENEQKLALILANVAQLNEVLPRTQKALEDKLEEMEQLRKERDAALADLEKFNGRLDQLEPKVVDLDQKYKVVLAERDTAMKQADQQHTAHRELRERVWEVIQQGVDREMPDDLKPELDGLSNTLIDLKADKADLTIRVNTLQLSFDALQDKNETQSEMLKLETKKNAKLEAQVQELQSKVAEMETDAQEAEKDWESLNDDNTELQHENEALKNELAQLKKGPLDADAVGELLEVAIVAKETAFFPWDFVVVHETKQNELWFAQVDKIDAKRGLVYVRWMHEDETRGAWPSPDYKVVDIERKYIVAEFEFLPRSGQECKLLREYVRANL